MDSREWKILRSWLIFLLVYIAVILTMIMVDLMAIREAL